MCNGSLRRSFVCSTLGRFRFNFASDTIHPINPAGCAGAFAAVKSSHVMVSRCSEGRVTSLFRCLQSIMWCGAAVLCNSARLYRTLQILERVATEELDLLTLKTRHIIKVRVYSETWHPVDVQFTLRTPTTSSSGGCALLSRSDPDSS